MRKGRTCRKAFVYIAAVIFWLTWVTTARSQEIRYDGQFALSPIGDLDMTLKFTLPMEKYQNLRESVSNLYLLLRDLASNRANVEVTNKKADWDDANRTLTFTIHMLGAARNMGNHWSIDVAEGAIFSNLDEGKRIVYFNESGEGAMGAMRGTSQLQLPAGATQCKYDASKKAVTYVLPSPSVKSRKTVLLIPAALLLVLGFVALGASFVVGRKPAGVSPASPPPKSPEA
jgi:hypothetical protein